MGPDQRVRAAQWAFAWPGLTRMGGAQPITSIARFVLTAASLRPAVCGCMHACRSLLRSVWQAVTEASRLLRVAVRVHCRHREPPRLAARAVPPSRAGNARMGFLQGLKLLVTVLLARYRLPPPTVAAGVPHAEFAGELMALPSALLVMVGEAIERLQV